MAKKIVVLLGLPGSGKGTQGAYLANKLGVPHISTGDIFRKMAKEKSNDSKLLNELMSSGKLVPSDLVNKIVIQFLLEDGCKNGCVLDGYPRNIDQANFLIKNINANLSVVFFDVKNEVVVKRVLGRYVCESCGALYNKYFAAPKIDGVCDVCGSREFISRADDDEVTVLSRIQEYNKETMPLIEYYKEKGAFFRVNAGAAMEEVMKEVSLIAKKI